MVAYSFQRHFVPAILAGTKCQTIRMPRRGRARHARVGDQVQLYTGMRTHACRKIGTARCVARGAVIIRLRPTPAVLVFGGRDADEIKAMIARGDRLPSGKECAVLTGETLDAFAVRDGFCLVEDFARFWMTRCRDLATPDRVAVAELIGWTAFVAAAARPDIDPLGPLEAG